MFAGLAPDSLWCFGEVKGRWSLSTHLSESRPSGGRRIPGLRECIEDDERGGLCGSATTVFVFTETPQQLWVKTQLGSAKLEMIALRQSISKGLSWVLRTAF